MTLRLFITGTDTNVGKTYIAVSLLNAFNNLGYKTIGIKPVASGAKYTDRKLYNHDALRLLKASSYKLLYEHINPFVFEESIAPHIAADKLGIKLTVQSVRTKLQHALTQPAEVFIIEGSGGWDVPLNSSELMSDLTVALEASVILVVGMRLGCINHALLTVKAIEGSGARLSGWIANCIDPHMKSLEANIRTLKDRIKAPHLGTLSYDSRG